MFEIAEDDSDVDKARLYLKRTGEFSTSTLTVRVETDDGGKPSGNLASAGHAGALDKKDVGTEYALHSVAFSGDDAAKLDKGTYWLVLDTDAETDAASNFVSWGTDAGGGYAGGALKVFSDGAWGDPPDGAASDAVFVVDGSIPGPPAPAPSTLTAAKFCIGDSCITEWPSSGGEGGGTAAAAPTEGSAASPTARWPAATSGPCGPSSTGAGWTSGS